MRGRPTLEKVDKLVGEGVAPEVCDGCFEASFFRVDTGKEIGVVLDVCKEVEAVRVQDAVLEVPKGLAVEKGVDSGKVVCDDGADEPERPEMYVDAWTSPRRWPGCVDPAVLLSRAANWPAPASMAR